MNPVLRSILSLRMLSALLLGFSSGLPLVLIGGTLKAWLRSQHVDLTVVGFFTIVGLPYTLKFLWAPLMDRYAVGFLDRRRGWIVVCQLALTGALIALAFGDPTANLKYFAVLAVVTAFLSASQDIVIDAYRRESLSDKELGLGSSLAVNGYRIAVYWSAAGALFMAGTFSWKTAYLVMAASMLLAVLATLIAPRTDPTIVAPRTLGEAVIGPLREFFARRGAIEVLLFILLYKLGDQLADGMLNPFYIDLKFDLKEIAVVSKTVGLWSTITGGIIGGVLILRIGLLRCLWLFGILQGTSVALFAVLARTGPDLSMLAVVVAVECVTSGMGTTAYVAFMASMTNRRYTATQYALLSSLMGIPRVLFGTGMGFVAKHLGWEGFFIFCTLSAVPGLLLLIRASRWLEPQPEPS